MDKKKNKTGKPPPSDRKRLSATDKNTLETAQNSSDEHSHHEARNRANQENSRSDSRDKSADRRKKAAAVQQTLKNSRQLSEENSNSSSFSVKRENSANKRNVVKKGKAKKFAARKSSSDSEVSRRSTSKSSAESISISKKKTEEKKRLPSPSNSHSEECSDVSSNKPVRQTSSTCVVSKSSTHRSQQQFTHEQIQNMRQFAKQCRQMNFSTYRDAFNSLPTPDPYECTAFQEIKNKEKNRYTNVMCLDVSRVQLFPNNEYIHANKLEYSSLKVPYIITQGPLGTTCRDFWRMIWQEDTRKIFMLCKSTEDGRSKCDEYFVRCGNVEPWQLKMENRPPLYSMWHGDINVSPLQQNYEDGIIFTELKISRGNAARRIMHYQCTDWADFSAPSSSAFASTMINKLIAKMDRVKNPQSIVVHCSAGIGRSGTLVAIQMLLRDFKEGKTIDVLEVIRNLRSVRCQAVQTLDQFLFIHKFILQFGESNRIIHKQDALQFYRLYDDFAKQIKVPKNA